jgi:hypothetical protein
VKLRDVLKPLGTEVTRHLPRSCGNIEIRVTIPGSLDSADITNAFAAAGIKPEETMLLLEIPNRSLPVLVPEALPQESWWNRWLESLKS